MLASRQSAGLQRPCSTHGAKQSMIRGSVRRGAAGRPSRAHGLLVRAAANPVANEKYDYIIVGGGSAGCVLANRLTTDGTKKVLVLEVYLARGKALGGSSCTNATLYLRGTPGDYDKWGLDGWKAEDLKPWFIQAENYANGPNAWHGQGGTMCTEQPRYDNPLHEEFFKSAAAVGLRANSDFNDWSRPQDGFGEFQVTQTNGQRADMYRMYLKPALQRGNLKVVTGARTTKLHFEKGANGTLARGVEFTTSGPSGDRFSAELAPGGEVLLSAGTVHSPHLLQLSGVGPAAKLLEHDIAVVQDLAGVGANLQDHPATLYAARTDDKYNDLAVTSQIYDAKSNIRISAVAQYLFGRNGPLATTGCDHGAFVSTTGQGEPDLQMRFVPGRALDPDAIQSYIIFGELKKKGLAWPCGITIQLLAARPSSRGTVGIKSSDPFTAPDIDINYFSGEGMKDLATLREGLKLSRRLVQSGPLSKYVTSESFPGTDSSSDADLDDFVRKSACSGNALTSTCRMGSSAEDGAVVSSRDLKVFGISNLRVIDASVLPSIVGGQTGAITVAIAERTAAAMLGKAPPPGGKTGSKVLVGSA